MATLAVAVAGCSGGAKQRSEVPQAQAESNGVRLSPSPAFASSRIAVDFVDPWIDASKCQFLWKQNGMVIEGARASSLEPSQFSKGQRISVEVTVPDSSGTSRSALTATVQVLNTPPSIVSAALTMSAATGVSELEANVQSTDPDGDRVSFEYRWFKNGAPIEGEGGASLKADKFTQADRVEVEVVASDGEASSPPVRSDAFALAIQNQPPQITSQPRAPRATDSDFRYQVVAEDKDGDPLRFDLVDAPDGMVVDPTGTIVWHLPAPEQRRGVHPVSVKVSDSRGGEAVQAFSIQLDPVPAKQ